MSTSLAITAFDQFSRAQPAAAAALQRAVATQTVAHAWLLFGPAGGGQVEAARYLGAALNCETGAAGGIPCGTCRTCTRILHGTHTAVRDFEPEGAFHRVEHVRDHWIPEATRSSLEARWKVLRIAAADKMNEAAQNAFLKILEEPPPGTVWVLDVADDAALLDTIISRCRRLDVTPWSQDLLRERLDVWVDAGEGDPGVGSGAESAPTEAPAGKRSSKKAEAVTHLPTPAASERAAMVRLAKGSPELLATLSTCDGRRVREAAVTTVEQILDLGPRKAGGAAPAIANQVLAVVRGAQSRIETRNAEALQELARDLGLLDDAGKMVRGRNFPPGVKKRHEDRDKREQREAGTTMCRLYLDLLASVMQDILVARQLGGAPPEHAVRNVDRLSSLQRAADRVDPVGIVEVLQSVEAGHVGLDLNGDRKLQMERVIVRVVLACAHG